MNKNFTANSILMDIEFVHKIYDNHSIKREIGRINYHKNEIELVYIEDMRNRAKRIFHI